MAREKEFKGESIRRSVTNEKTCSGKIDAGACNRGIAISTRDHIEDHTAIEGIGEIIFTASH